MYPTIADGDFILAQKYVDKPVIGSIAVIQHSAFGRLIKRISLVPGTDNFVATGDNALSAKSSAIGEIKVDAIKYHATWRISPAGFSRLNTRDVPRI
jgi:hypothetical protein